MFCPNERKNTLVIDHLNNWIQWMGSNYFEQYQYPIWINNLDVETNRKKQFFLMKAKLFLPWRSKVQNEIREKKYLPLTWENDWRLLLLLCPHQPLRLFLQSPNVIFKSKGIRMLSQIPRNLMEELEREC